MLTTDLPSITPVILCGGSGTRLWPLSRQSLPKQFVPLIGNQSLLQLTLQRVAALGQAPIAVAAEVHRFMVLEAFQAVPSGGTLLLEPAARNHRSGHGPGGAARSGAGPRRGAP